MERIFPCFARLILPIMTAPKESIVSDPTWKSSTGAVRYSEIYNGETIDARMDKSGWTLPGYNDKDWSGVKETAFPTAETGGHG